MGTEVPLWEREVRQTQLIFFKGTDRSNDVDNYLRRGTSSQIVNIDGDEKKYGTILLSHPLLRTSVKTRFLLLCWTLEKMLDRELVQCEKRERDLKVKKRYGALT